MPAFTPGEARGLSRLRATSGLGFLLAAAFAGCMAPGPVELARRADAAHKTSVFSWLVAHDPSALVAWGVQASEVRAIVPDSHVSAASAYPCAQAKAAHAVLLIVAAANRPERERAEDCGFALARDAGAIVVAPL